MHFSRLCIDYQNTANIFAERTARIFNNKQTAKTFFSQKEICCRSVIFFSGEMISPAPHYAHFRYIAGFFGFSPSQ